MLRSMLQKYFLKHKLCMNRVLKGPPIRTFIALEAHTDSTATIRGTLVSTDLSLFGFVRHSPA